MRMTKGSAILFCVGFGVASNAVAVLAPIQGDASIDSIALKTNYGNDTKLQIGGSKNPPTDYRQTVLKFDLSLLPNGTAGADVEKATMFIWVSAVSNPGGAGNTVPKNMINVSAVNSSWLETGVVTKDTNTGVTFQNQPAIATPFTTISVADVPASQYLAIDLTQQVRGWLDTPGSNYGIELVPDFDHTTINASFLVTMDSRENPGHPPIVDITLLSGDAVGPAGPPGAAATIQVGSTVTGAPGTAAVVSNGGTSSAALLNFTIPRGAVGATGPAGSAGATGPAGPVGATGSIGATGAMGPAGATGPAGASGAAGATGPSGAAGAPGTNGNTVLNGSVAPTPEDGVDGDFYVDTQANVLYGPKSAGGWPETGVSLMGPAGASGAQGPTGAAGADGAPGPAGAQGPKGDTGVTGAQGPKGDTGAQGPKGDTGAMGPQGVQGATGATGATGAVGPQGAPGAQGAAGPQGIQGPQGPDGAQGPVGPQGPAGPAGSQRFRNSPTDATTPEFGLMPQQIGVPPNYWWMSTSAGRFATGISMSSTDDPVTHTTTWFITALGRNLHFLAAGCTGNAYTVDAVISVDQDLMLLQPGSPSLTYGAALIVDLYTPDFTQAPSNHNFMSILTASTGVCTNTSTGSLKGRPVTLATQGIAVTNAIALRN